EESRKLTRMRGVQLCCADRGRVDLFGSGYAGLGWSHTIPIPEEHQYWGEHIDFAKGGVIAEAQFSNYPFMINNLLRSEIFFREEILFAGIKACLVVIITKAHMFPASNSTLYYEQGRKQLAAMVQGSLLSVPVRLVGLFEEKGKVIAVRWTEYDDARYSRTIQFSRDRAARIVSGRSAEDRCKIIFESA
ncbi:MAG: hypothetical protein MN733_05805, partial [Nitrososphaera sp.]|nr:hypothetical protein [Nitrososphaera sp.]